MVQKALADAADSPGYPTTVGRRDTRQACVDWLSRRFGVTGLGVEGVLPVIGSKELIASLPSHLGLGSGDLVVHPALAYPTYEVGARLAGARTMATDALTAVGPEQVAIVWVNSPANPTGRVLPADHLRKVVAWCRERGALLVSDECYLECAWEGPERAPVSVLHPDVCGGDHTGILTVQSLSKRSNLAGYRCAFVAGDPAVVAELLAVRKNLGLMMPGPQQHAMQVALDDDAARGGAARPLRAAPRPAACRDRGCGTARRPLRRRAVPLGHPWRALLGHASAGSPSAASSWLRGRSTAPPVPSTCGSRSPRPTSGVEAGAQAPVGIG